MNARTTYSRFSAADGWLLVCSGGILLGFAALVWVGSASGLGLLIGGAALPTPVQNSPLLFLIPLAGAVGLVTTLWGLLKPTRKGTAALLNFAAGLAALAYFVTFAVANMGYFIGTIRFTGVGFWVALMGSAGLIIQMIAPRGRKRKPVEAEPQTAAGRMAQGAAEVASAAGSMLTAPVRAAIRPFTTGCVALAFGFGACVACAVFLPSSFQAILDIVRNATVRSYVLVTEITGRPVLKVIVYEADVTAVAVVQRDMGALGALFGEGAEIRGKVRVNLGADLKAEQFGVLSCEIDAGSVQEFIGRAPLAGTAFDANAIRKAAYDAFKQEAAKQAIDQFWQKARSDMLNRFEIWAVDLAVPEAPTLTTCPVESGESTTP
ncbi:MAG: hypothetical protein IT322_06845 [Anaerolineae bacterium]|nr:hypothetical protein [Anaerolineae bacterium]CAG0988017.1 hypothetical protein ANRL4_02288 [Anaerolineae bacterium]